MAILHLIRLTPRVHVLPKECRQTRARNLFPVMLNLPRVILKHKQGSLGTSPELPGCSSPCPQSKVAVSVACTPALMGKTSVFVQGDSVPCESL